MLMSEPYPDPVDRLLTYGSCLSFREWPNYLELGLTREHVPDLIRMATDSELNEADIDSSEVWAPIHAWRALGQLRAETAIQPLLSLFETADASDWVLEEIPEVLGMIGQPAIAPLADYMSQASRDPGDRIGAARALERIGTIHPDAREEAVSALTRELERFRTNGPDLNGFLVSGLIDLKAVESISTIRDAFAHNRVDLSIAGDIEDVEIEMGLRTTRTSPAHRTPLLGTLFAPVARAKPKIGRNDPCPCGSGKKYKKCCLNK
jgi:hypothetical protein